MPEMLATSLSGARRTGRQFILITAAMLGDVLTVTVCLINGGGCVYRVSWGASLGRQTAQRAAPRESNRRTKSAMPSCQVEPDAVEPCT